jgi:hypothetical protein
VDLVALSYLSELLQNGWQSYFHLVQELIDGSMHRHTFSAWELDLLLDLEVSRLRKSSRPDVLRRYFRFIQAESLHAPQPTRFSAFLEAETAHRRAAKAGDSG